VGRLEGKVALVTGGARGMGAAYVRRFTNEGAKVVFGDVLTAEGAELAADVVGRSGDGCRFVPMDVTSPEDWTSAVAAALDAYGRLDVLINNAGIIKLKPIVKMTLEECRRVLDVNLVGQWLGVRAVIEPMRAAGNSIHPGAILTPMTTDPDIVAATAGSAEAFFKQLPLGRMGKTRDVTGIAVYLASDESSYCTGGEYLVDGGMLTGAGY
jgi:3alpha(or 20beta)-hydroxysteroid dehydrogenase